MRTTAGTIVGTVTIGSNRKYRYDISATASRYEEVLLAPGTYDVTASHAHHNDFDVELFAAVPGTVVSRYDGSEYGGSYIGKGGQYERHPDVGKRLTVPFRVAPDTIDWNDAGAGLLAWETTAMLRSRAGGGLDVSPFRILRWADRVDTDWKMQAPGALAEHFDDASILAGQVNELTAEGVYPQVWETHRYGSVINLHERTDHVPHDRYKEFVAANR